ncbi:Uncharacterised protein [Mycobacteroides abscessus subsp. abscessus]|nr:Uncharacterised protein [Mycobacteroides abscessus subsp. abscessus]
MLNTPAYIAVNRSMRLGASTINDATVPRSSRSASTRSSGLAPTSTETITSDSGMISARLFSAIRRPIMLVISFMVARTTRASIKSSRLRKCRYTTARLYPASRAMASIVDAAYPRAMNRRSAASSSCSCACCAVLPPPGGLPRPRGALSSPCALRAILSPPPQTIY